MKPLGKWTWIAALWGLVGGGWGLLQAFGVPAIDSVYLPLLLWKSLAPELAIVMTIITLLALYPWFARHASGLKTMALGVVRPPADVEPTKYKIALIVLLLLSSPLWARAGWRVAYNTLKLAEGRARYYRVVFFDYYADALENEADRQFSEGDMEGAANLYRAAARRGGGDAGSELQDKIQAVEMRVAFARNQADRSSAARRIGMSPLVVSLDIDAARLYPGSRHYRQRLVDDDVALEKLFTRSLNAFSTCAAKPQAEIVPADSAAMDSFAPHAVLEMKGQQPQLDCGRVRAVCKDGPELCQQQLKLHMQADRLATACATLAGEASGLGCRDILLGSEENK